MKSRKSNHLARAYSPVKITFILVVQLPRSLAKHALLSDQYQWVKKLRVRWSNSRYPSTEGIGWRIVHSLSCPVLTHEFPLPLSRLSLRLNWYYCIMVWTWSWGASHQHLKHLIFIVVFLKYNNKRGIHHCSLLYAFLHWIWKSALLLSWDYKPKKYLPNSILLRSFSNRLSRCNVFNPCFGFSCDCILDQSWSISRRSKYSHFYPHNHMVFFLFLPVMPTKSTFLYTFPLWEHVVFISRVTGYTYLDSRTPWIFTNWEKQ